MENVEWNTLVYMASRVVKRMTRIRPSGYCSLASQPTICAAGLAAAVARAEAQWSGSMMSSESKNMVQGVRTRAKPALRALAAPGRGSMMTSTAKSGAKWVSAQRWSTARVESVELLSTSTTANGRRVCAATEASVRSTMVARLYTGITMVISLFLIGIKFLLEYSARARRARHNNSTTAKVCIEKAIA